MARELYYVTGNVGKFEEVKDFMARVGSNIDLKRVDLDLAEMQTLDHEGVAVDKAKQAWRAVQRPLLVDDAGVYFDAYHRFPGTLTKFVYEGIGFKGMLKLTEDDHRAYFLIYVVYINGPLSLQVFEGRCDGKIVEPKVLQAHPKLPFDDVFVPIGENRTFAELRSAGEIDPYSYRIMAVKKFLDWYK